MALQVFSGLIALFLCAQLYATEENFLLINGVTDEIIMEMGPHNDERLTPCSSFKLVLSLMGFDAGILIDESSPTWFFSEGYDDFKESWKEPQTPRTWMKESCLWYSKVLALHLGEQKFQNYLDDFAYGNKDMSGGLTTFWVNSSLKVSPREQVAFLQKMLRGELSISKHAIEMTKSITFQDYFEGGKLFGKTGWSGVFVDEEGKRAEIGWLIGWIEKDEAFYPFAYSIREGEKKIELSQRLPRVKQLLKETLLD